MTPGIRLIVPTNSATKAVAGRAVQLGGRGALFDPAGPHHGDPVRHRQGLFLVVRDEQGGDAEFLLKAADLLAQGEPHLGVQRRQRFVEQQDPRAQGERAGERDALLLAAGELVREPLALVGEPDQLQQLGRPGAPLGRAAPCASAVRRPRCRSAFRCGKRLYDWKTIPASRRWAGTPVTSCPSTRTSPESGCSNPASMRSAVVLPQPEGPSRARSSPGRTVRSRPSRATVGPNSRRRATEFDGGGTVPDGLLVLGGGESHGVVIPGTRNGMGHAGRSGRRGRGAVPR